MSRPAIILVEHDSTDRERHGRGIAEICPSEIEVVSASGAEEGLRVLHSVHGEDRAVEIVIARQKMPSMTGTRFLEIVHAQFPGVGKILLSEQPSLDEAIYAFNNTGLDKYIPLPWGPEDIKFTITSLLRQREMKRINTGLLADLKVRNRELTDTLGELQEARHELEGSYIQTVQSLAVALEAKDRYTAGHSQRVARFSVLIARSLGLSPHDVDLIGQVALLHDIGKIGMLDKVLNKPANLSPEEREMIKAHPVVGAQILGPVRTFSKHVAGIRHHHEMYDGSGYPDHLKGKEIPLAARIVCLADAFDAMTSTRPYRVGLPLESALQEMQKMSGLQFCPECVDAFIRVLRTSGVIDAPDAPFVGVPGPAPSGQQATGQPGAGKPGGSPSESKPADDEGSARTGTTGR